MLDPAGVSRTSEPWATAAIAGHCLFYPRMHAGKPFILTTANMATIIFVSLCQGVLSLAKHGSDGYRADLRPDGGEDRAMRVRGYCSLQA